MNDPFHAWATLETKAGTIGIHRLAALSEAGIGDIDRLPFSIKVLLEAALRNHDGFAVTDDHVRALANWPTRHLEDVEIPFMPSRVILQDFTGVPAVVDLAALRSAMARAGGDPQRINPQVPVDLVIDHSVQVDAFGSMAALFINAEREFERNRERYEFLHWGKDAFDQFRVVPPASGIVHQVNLEYLGEVVSVREIDGRKVALPDSLVGTDSHTTMINGLGIVGWGVGGIEAEAVMLGQPIYMLMPAVVGFELSGKLPEGATATDLVLTATEMLRNHGVVGKFVEYYGAGIAELSLADRATLANMAPEYGATMGFFPVDAETLRFLERTGRGDRVDLVERYCREQGLFHDPGMPTPAFSETLKLDLATVVPSLAGPKRPQDRVALTDMKRSFYTTVTRDLGRTVDAELSLDGGAGEANRHPRRQDLYRGSRVPVEYAGVETHLAHGSVVIAAITSCTNTSNPSVMVAAGLLAKKAVERGLDSKPWVKTSLAPGSRVVTRYLDEADLTGYLQALGFHTVGYGCTTCIGNSGPLPAAIATAVVDNDLVVASVLSGNRNFEGRINPHTRANYLASPPLVVAYAIAGTVDIDMATEPLGIDPNGQPVYLADIWPSQAEIADTIARSLDPEMYAAEYKHIFEGDDAWKQIQSSGGAVYDWQDSSTYIKEPPFFTAVGPELPPRTQVKDARVLALLGDSITTDHISPAGAIPPNSPTTAYLEGLGVERRDFNSYGSRRGNHEVMMRGTFGNVRLRNQLAPGTEGGWTRHLPTGEVTSIYDASMRYQDEGTSLVVLAGKEYGTGSSRDWAAKGTLLLGVQAVIAESYERIHRSNLVGMGVLPLQFAEGQGWRQLGLTGEEHFDIAIPDVLLSGQTIAVTARSSDGSVMTFDTVSRLDSPVDLRYYENGGILHTVLREFMRAELKRV
jgi:aconitate hydratase